MLPIFGVRVSVTFHLMFVHNILVRFWLLIAQSVDSVFSLILIISRFGFEGGVWFLDCSISCSLFT